jgi:hypothetical protein
VPVIVPDFARRTSTLRRAKRLHRGLQAPRARSRSSCSATTWIAPASSRRTPARTRTRWRSRTRTTARAANLFIDSDPGRGPKAALSLPRRQPRAHVERWASVARSQSQKDAREPPRALRPPPRCSSSNSAASNTTSARELHGSLDPRDDQARQVLLRPRHRAFEARDRDPPGQVRRERRLRSRAPIACACRADGHERRARAWCPGTLAKLQPLYAHTSPSSWSHGYGVQWVLPSGKFAHMNVAIAGGESMLPEFARRVA